MVELLEGSNFRWGKGMFVPGSRSTEFSSYMVRQWVIIWIVRWKHKCQEHARLTNSFTLQFFERLTPVKPGSSLGSFPTTSVSFIPVVQWLSLKDLSETRLCLSFSFYFHLHLKLCRSCTTDTLRASHDLLICSFDIVCRSFGSVGRPRGGKGKRGWELRYSL